MFFQFSYPGNQDLILHIGVIHQVFDQVGQVIQYLVTKLHIFKGWQVLDD